MTNNQDCSDPSSDGDLPPGPTGNRTHDREGDRDRQRTKRGGAAPLHDREENSPRDADERRDQESTTARRGDALSASEPTGHGPHMASYRCDPDRMRLGTTGDEQRNADGHRPFSASITPTSTPARFPAVRYMFEAPGLPEPWVVGSSAPTRRATSCASGRCRRCSRR